MFFPPAANLGYLEALRLTLRDFSFKTAWVSVWEKYPCADIFGEMDVTGKDLVSMAKGIVAYER